MEERLTELESRYSFQEDLLQELNKVVTSQGNQIDMLIAQIRHLHGQVKDLHEQSDKHSLGSTTEEKPPHY